MTAAPHLAPSLRIALALAGVVVLAPLSVGQELKQPVYRVTKQEPAVQTASNTTEDWFDLTPRGDEHPLAPAKRLAEKALKEMDAEKKDYSCLFVKRERINGELGDVQYIDMQVINQPFAVHMTFIKPNKGQECLYVKGANDDKLLARGHGVRRWAGVLTLDPHGSMAMEGQRHPITKAGIRNLTTEIIQIAENDMKYGECSVNVYPNEKNDDRPAVMIEAIHPVPRKEFKFHIARIYIDREYRVPVRFEAYSWPTEAGGKPVLEEQYVYTRLKFNNGYKVSDFSTSNPNYFK